MSRFAVLPTKAIEDRNLSHACFRVLAALGTFSDRHGWCWPSHAAVAEVCGIARNKVAGHINELVEAGYLTKKARRDDEHGHRSNLYQIRLDFDPVPHEGVEGIPREGVEAMPPEGVPEHYQGTPQGTPPTIMRPDGRWQGSEYAFGGRLIRLKPADYARWRKAYFLVNLDAELTALDDFYDQTLEGAERSKWYVRCSAALAKKQAKLATDRPPPRRQAKDVMAELLAIGNE